MTLKVRVGKKLAVVARAVQPNKIAAKKIVRRWGGTGRPACRRRAAERFLR